MQLPFFESAFLAWSGIAYHAAFFARIKPAARLFGATFVLQTRP